MKIISIANHKGGVAKTASTHALAEAMTEKGYRVLCIDNDAQASLTNAFGIDSAQGVSMNEVYGSVQLGAKTIKQVIKAKGDGVPHLAPSDLAMAVDEIGLVTRSRREYILRDQLNTVSEFYDFCLIDCSPSAGLHTYNALTASDYVVIPSVPEIAPVRGIRLMIRTVDKVKRELNPDIAVIGVLPTMYNERTTHHKLGFEALHKAGLNVFPVSITRTVKVSEAMTMGKSIITSDPDHKVADQYRRAATYTIESAK